MDFFKVRKFKKANKPQEGEDLGAEKGRSVSDEPKDGNLETMPKTAAADPAAEAGEDEDDDDFITNEVKRRLKELRKNSFMVLIPEEGYPEDEEEGSSSSEWRESEVGDGYQWCGFDALYDKYCERMLFFHKMMAQHLKDAGTCGGSKQSPRSASKKLASSLRNISFKKRDGLSEECDPLQLTTEDNPHQNIEVAYVAHICLSWEALYCQYMQLSQKLSETDNMAPYDYAAQAFQQFQVLLQRFIENEPFEQGSRVEVYVHARSSLPKLLQVPNLKGVDQNHNIEDDLDQTILASDLIKIIEDSILTFRLLVKMDKKKTTSIFGSNSHAGSSLQQVQASLEKKELKLKEMFKKKKGWKKKTWPTSAEEVDLLLGLIDIKVISRVLRMGRLSKEQLLWCEEKMSKLDLSDNKLRRDGSPILFPC